MKPYQKEPPTDIPQVIMYHILKFRDTYFSENILMVASVVNIIGTLTLYWSEISNLLNQQVDLWNLITSVITSLFKPYSKQTTFSLAFNFEKDESSL